MKLRPDIIMKYLCWQIYCPGCQTAHRLSSKIHQLSGTEAAPSFQPSLLQQRFEHEGKLVLPRCHSWIRAGQIEFLPDSEHALAGQTVPLPDYPAGLP